MRIVVIITLLLLSLSVHVSRAQMGSPALDPNCYFPTVGVLNEIDTIYGYDINQKLGWQVRNLGPLPGESYGQIAIGNIFTSSNPTYPIVSSGPSFNLHKLHIQDTLKMGDYDWRDPRDIYKRGYFRSSKKLDVLYGEPPPGLVLPRLYLSDDKGGYDSTHFIQLKSQFEDTDFFYHSYSYTNLITTHFSSDSVNDILCSVVRIDTTTKRFHFYLMIFKGGDTTWDNAKYIYPDEVLFVEDIDNANHPYRFFTTGDFRGLGKEDIIAADWTGNLFYYKNDSTFSLNSFLNSIQNDTLLARWQNPTISQPLGGAPYEGNKLTMRAFPKESTDRSVDFVPDVFRNYNGQTYHDICIFKGGSEFGSKRIFIDSADFTIHEPKYYDSKFSGIGFNKLYNCGDMTGTSNPVLFVDAGSGFYSAAYFYVLGKAMDDKIDMYFDMDDFGNFSSLDTLVADGDALQDIIMGFPGYYSHQDLDSGKQWVGTIFVVHGSNKIPVRTASVPSSKLTNQFSLYPNPTQTQATLHITAQKSEELTVILRDILGREVYQTHRSVTEGDKQIPLTFPILTSGTYYLEVSGKSLPVLILDE